MQKLSRERYSLLSKEQKEQYLFNHVLDNSFKNNINESNNYIDTDNINLKETKKLLEGIYGKETFNDIQKSLPKKELNVLINECINTEVYNTKPINEAFTGVDSVYWVPNFGWIGKIFMSGLTIGILGIGKLVSAASQQLAIFRLKKLMKRIVELVDNGAFKNNEKGGIISRVKGALSFLIGRSSKSANSREDNRSSFKTYQKAMERSAALSTLCSAKTAGLVKDINSLQTTSIDNLGGLKYFYKNIIEPYKSITNFSKK